MSGAPFELTKEKLSKLRAELLSLEGDDLVRIHGWLIGVTVAIERKRGVPYWHQDELTKELRASSAPPDHEDRP